MKTTSSGSLLAFSFSLLCICVSTHEKIPSHTHTSHTAAPRYTPTHTQTSRFVSATTYACPEGYFLQHKTCIRKTALDFEHVCEGGSRATSNGLCAHTTEAVKTCAPGEEMRGNVCVSHVKQTPIPMCPSGYTYMENKCVLKINSAHMCKKGSVYVDEHICAHKALAKTKCPNDYVFEEDICIKRSHKKPIQQCPIGMQLRAKTNVCEFQVKSVPVCPLGTYLSEKGCVKNVEKVSVCPHNDDIHTYTHYNNDTCVMRESIKHISVCHNGGVYDSEKKNCVVDVNVPLEPVCVGKFALIDNVCEKTVTSPANMLCPDMYDLKGGVCVKNISYDCSETKKDVVCEDRMPVDTKGKDTHTHTYPRTHAHTHAKQISNTPPLRILGRFVARHGHTHTQGHTPAHTHTHTPTQLLPYCKLQQEVIHKECNKTLHADISSVCEKDAYIHNGVCIESEFQTPEYECKATGGTHNCHVTEYQDPMYMCPDGYRSTHSDTHTHTHSDTNTHTYTHTHRALHTHTHTHTHQLQCVKESFTPKLYVCPENTHGDMCELTIEENVCEGGLCITDTKQEPVSYVCPSGYTYTTHTLVSSAYAPEYTKHAHTHTHTQKTRRRRTHIHAHTQSPQTHTHKKVVCTQIEYTAPDTFCDEGYEKLDTFTCAKLHPAEKVVEAISVLPTHICEDGFVFDDALMHCVQEWEKKAEAVCPNGYVSDTETGGCVKLLRPKKICPHGSIYAKGQCWVYKKTQPFEVQTSIQTLPHTFTHTLRKGFHHTANVIG